MNSPSSLNGNQPKSSVQLNLGKFSPQLSPSNAHLKAQYQGQQNVFALKKTEQEKSLTNSANGFTQSGGKNTHKYISQAMSPSHKNNLASRPIPSFLESKNGLKNSLMAQDFYHKIPQSIYNDTRRSPRMSQDCQLDIRTSHTQFGENKVPSFLQKNQKEKQYIFKKRTTEDELIQTRDSSNKQLSRTTSGSTIQVDPNEKVSVRKSSFDPTAAWIKQSWSKKKEKKFTISDFQQIKELGCGKYGHVYLAKEKKTNLICALKIIEKKLLKEQEITEQFIRQLKIQMFLNHPNIIKMYGFFDDVVNIYIILQVGTGGQLFKHLKKSQSMPQPKCAHLMRQICQAINEIHSNHIIHRDLKPQNIVMHDNVIKLCDFGWSVYMDKNLRTTFCGTPLYVCPQILRGKDYDQKIDIWSLGVMMYEMVVGENPFKITKEEELIKIVKDAVIIPSYVELSREAKDFLDCCLQKNPEKRSTIRELLNHSFFRKYPEKSEKKMGI